MAWSMVKESATRRLVARGVPYDVALMKLSDLQDEDVPVAERELEEDRRRGA